MAKRRAGSQIDSLTLRHQKLGIAPISSRAGGMRQYHWKVLNEGYNFDIKYQQHSTIANSFMKNNKQKEIIYNKLLRGDIVTFDHYLPPKDKTWGQGWNIITPKKELPSLTLLQLLE
jgi:Zn-dependent M32 family carboxypeptidase